MVRSWFVFSMMLMCEALSISASQIDRVSCSVTKKRIDVLISSSTPITSFQKPERSGSSVILRFPDCTISSNAVDSSCLGKGIGIVTEHVRSFALVRITSSDHRGTILAQRNGANEVLLSIESTDSTSHWNFDVLVIDAGHGGVDAGAEGVNGVYEKNITLSIAKRLRDLVTARFPQTNVVMTRETDIFVELYKRTQIANEAKGKLFISIHCNSMPTKPHPAHGCETYILRPGRNADAANVAARENASIEFENSNNRYATLDEESLIVATMAQRAFVRFSEELASEVGKSMAQQTSLKNRGVNQAGFFVLVGASMPNILFETAFLSNTTDAAYISSSKGQDEVADALVEAVAAYVKTYEKAIGK